ncbi:MAG: hypothetical protein JW818_17570 [Pirellulales bacterium]|nr:hypothetical protein [Pirellulales bacterium]
MRFKMGLTVVLLLTVLLLAVGPAWAQRPAPDHDRPPAAPPDVLAPLMPGEEEEDVRMPPPPRPQDRRGLDAERRLRGDFEPRPDRPHDRPPRLEGPDAGPGREGSFGPLDVDGSRPRPPRPNVGPGIGGPEGPMNMPGHMPGPRDVLVPRPDDPMGPGRPGGNDPQMIPFRFRDADPEVVATLSNLAQADHILAVQSNELAERFRRSEGEERAKIRERLVQTVNKHFEVRQERREFELKQVEKEVERLRNAIKRRSEAREAIVERHIRRLTGEKDELEF